MCFDFDAFAGALWALSEAIEGTAHRLGLPLDLLATVLTQSAKVRKDKWAVQFWRSAHSQTELGKWIRKRAGKGFDVSDEEEIVRLAKQIPSRVRRDLIQFAQLIPSSRGGNPKVLTGVKGFQARHAVNELRKKGRSQTAAYQEVARRLKVAAHTVRRTCEPKERERMRSKPKGIAFAHVDPTVSDDWD